MIKFTGDLRCDFEKAAAEIIKLKDRIPGYQEQIASLRSSVKTLRKTSDSDRNRFQETLAEKDIPAAARESLKADRTEICRNIWRLLLSQIMA